MKISPLLFLLCLALPLRAQEAPQQPKEFGFNFSYSFSEKTRVTSVEVGYQREFPDAKPVPFDTTLIGKKGLISQEKLSFLDEKGQVLGTLSSEFDANGLLQSQSLSETDKPSRPLDWFKTGQKSPSLTIPNSAMQASYTLKNGKLSERVLELKTPSGSREFRTQYDGQGRRDNDRNNSGEGLMSVRYFYSDEGLIRLLTNTPTGKPTEVTLARAPNGTLSTITTKEDGVLIGRMLPNLDETGRTLKMRLESFDNGILSSAAEMSPENKQFTKEEYDEGVLLSRKVLTADTTGGQKLQSVEEFEVGRLQKRTNYDDEGAVKSITTYNADGSVKTTQTFQNGVEVAPAK